jgi:hypothetical protein
MHAWCREPACSVDETEICKIPLEPSWIKTARSKAKRGIFILVSTKNWKAERNGIFSKDETYSSKRAVLQEALPKTGESHSIHPLSWMHL